MNAGLRISRGRLAAFAAGSLGTGLFSTVPTVLLLFYCTEILGIHPSVAAVILFLPKAWCLFWDPYVGSWSDRSRTRWGRRVPFMVIGALGTAGGFLLMFHTPPGGGTFTVLYVGISYFLATTFYTLFSVPYITVPAEISPNAHERERAVAWRMPCVLAGVLLGASVAPHAVALGGQGAEGYSFMARWISVAALFAMLMAVWAVSRFEAKSPANTESPEIALYLHRPFQRLVLAYVMQISAVAYLFAAMPYIVTQVLNEPPEFAGTLLGALLATGTVTIPAWAALARRFGTQRSLTAATMLFAAALVGLVFLDTTAPQVLVLAGFAALGAPVAALMLLPFMLLAHLINAHAVEHGQNSEGAFTGLFVAAEKVALAVGSMLVGLGLTALGHAGNGMPDDAAVGEGIRLLAVVVPALLCMASLLIGNLLPASNPK